METEISGRVRNTELVKIINWIPKVWHHLNRFLEAHSSSDVTIGRWEAKQVGASCWVDGVGSGLSRALDPSRIILWVLSAGQDSTQQRCDAVLTGKEGQRNTSSQQPLHHLENPASLQ